MRTKDFKVYYDKIQIHQPLDFEFDISKIAFKLLDKMHNSNTLYRSIGIVLEDFSLNSEEQLSLFDSNPKRTVNENLGKSLDKLEQKFGRNIVRTGFVNKNVPYKQGAITLPKDS